jgi:hypothetical protein
MEKVMGGLFLNRQPILKVTMGVIPAGLPILSNLLRYETFAVRQSPMADGGMSHALHLPEMRDLTTGKLDNPSI